MIFPVIFGDVLYIKAPEKQAEFSKVFHLVGIITLIETEGCYPHN